MLHLLEFYYFCIWKQRVYTNSTEPKKNKHLLSKKHCDCCLICCWPPTMNTSTLTFAACSNRLSAPTQRGKQHTEEEQSSGRRTVKEQHYWRKNRNRNIFLDFWAREKKLENDQKKKQTRKLCLIKPADLLCSCKWGHFHSPPGHWCWAQTLPTCLRKVIHAWQSYICV